MWNSKVVQLFFDAGREDDVPQFVMENVNYTVGTDGKYAFQSWSTRGTMGSLLRTAS